MRLRLTALYAALFGTAAGLLLGLCYWLMRRHLDRTLPETEADAAASELALQFALAFSGTMLLAVLGGWLLAGRALAPLRRVTDTARRVSGERLDQRVALEGPADEVRRLAETVDDMLDRLEESFEAQRRFVANASHELRTPLTVIRTEAEVALADDRADVARLREMGAAVIEGVDRAEALLDGLMTLARSQRGLVRREPVDLADCLRPAVSLAAREAGTRGIELRVATDRAVVAGDRRLLERLVANLMENAVLYNRPRGVVWARTSLDDDAAVLRIENTGAPLSAQEVERLAEPFERLGRYADGSGAGLGLSIARSVVRAHGGELSLGARPEGGLAVEARLPPAGAPAPSPPPPGARRVRPAGRTSAASRARRPA